MASATKATMAGRPSISVTVAVMLQQIVVPSGRVNGIRSTDTCSPRAMAWKSCRIAGIDSTGCLSSTVRPIELFPTVAEDPAGGRVGFEKAPLAVGDDDAHRSDVEDGAEALLAVMAVHGRGQSYFFLTR